jgi:hypothetical protein
MIDYLIISQHYRGFLPTAICIVSWLGMFGSASSLTVEAMPSALSAADRALAASENLSIRSQLIFTPIPPPCPMFMSGLLGTVYTNINGPFAWFHSTQVHPALSRAVTICPTRGIASGSPGITDVSNRIPVNSRVLSAIRVCCSEFKALGVLIFASSKLASAARAFASAIAARASSPSFDSRAVSFISSDNRSSRASSSFFSNGFSKYSPMNSAATPIATKANAIIFPSLIQESQYAAAAISASTEHSYLAPTTGLLVLMAALATNIPAENNPNPLDVAIWRRDDNGSRRD